MRLASEEKAGFYPTPPKTTQYISAWLHFPYEEYHVLDPCCGEGVALEQVSKQLWFVETYGIELDCERALKANRILNNTLQGSIYEAKILPLQCMGMLYLNPPYAFENKERAEMKFLKHSYKWLAPEGVLVFIVPEHILNEKNMLWINRYFKDINIVRIHKEEYPRFKQVVLFARKRDIENTEPDNTAPVYNNIPYIEDVEPICYKVPSTQAPTVFQMGSTVTKEDIVKNRNNVIHQIMNIFDQEENDTITTLNPILPLRKGHIIALLTAGMLNGKIEKEDGDFIVVTGYTTRVRTETEKESKKIVKDSYAAGIRVIERGKWYDVQ